MTPSRTNQRAAFTLLEIIIATSLTTAILLILWSLFGTYAKLEEQGNQATTETQLVRALYRQLQSDLNRLTSAPAPMPRRLSARPQQNPSEPVAPMESLDRLTFPAGTQLVGNQSRLELTLASQPSDYALQIRPVSAVLPTVFTIIEYEWTGQTELTEATQLRREPGDRLGEKTPLVAEPSTGLRRTLAPWIFDLQGADNPIAELSTPGRQASTAPPSPETSPPGQEDFIPEVSALQLQYFDGTAWLPQWNSSSLGRLPVAIKISFNLEPLVDLDAPLESEGGRETTLPLREPSETAANNAAAVLAPSLAPYIEKPFEYQFIIAINAPGFPPPDTPEVP